MKTRFAVEYDTEHGSVRFIASPGPELSKIVGIIAQAYHATHRQDELKIRIRQYYGDQ